MVNFVYKRIIRIREMAFGTIQDTVQKGCDVVYMHSNDEINNAGEIKRHCITHEQFTLVNNLTEEEDKILSRFNKNYKNEIKRAVREGCLGTVCSGTPTEYEKDISDFSAIYNQMFSSKGMKNSFNKAIVSSEMKAGEVLITKGYHPDKRNCMVYHSYLADGENAVLMYSASTLNELKEKEDIHMIGWLNKFLHWHDMKWFKEHKYVTYEWGGISSIENPNGIDKFKMGFGGERKKYMTANSLIGELYLLAVKNRNSQWK